MGEIIEHRDDGEPLPVRVGEGDLPVSLKAYQHIYHQITGRTEQITKKIQE